MKNFKSLLLVVIFMLASLFVACNEEKGDENVTPTPDFKEEEKVVPIFQGVNFEEEETLKLSAKKLSASEEFSDVIKQDFGVLTTDEISHFSEKGAKKYITLNFYNPSQFEILSFVLNGTKYQSYQFAEYSTSDKISVAIVMPEVSGITEYTVEQIKYIDGSEIKDVRMDGSNKIKVGILYDSMPTVITNYQISHNSLLIQNTIADVNDVVAATSGTFRLYILDESGIVHKEDLKKGDNAKIVEGLKVNKLYSYIVCATLNAYDGKGMKVVTLDEGVFTTKDLISVENVVVDSKTLSYEIKFDKDGITVNSNKLILNDSVVKEVSGKTVKFEGLYSNTTYKVEIEYTMNGNKYTTVKEYQTEKLIEPVVDITVEPGKTNITYEIISSDESGILKIDSVKLVKNGSVVKTLNTLSGNFDNIHSNSEYSVVCNYSYNMNEGNSDVKNEIQKSINTLEVIKPNVGLNITTLTEEKVIGDVVVSDIDNVYQNVSVDLYQGNNLIKQLSNASSFDFDTKANVNYNIKVNYVYNLKDGSGNINETYEYELRTNKKVPTLTFTEYYVSKDSIDYNILIQDENVTGHINFVSLYQGNNLVKKLDDSDTNISNLQTNTYYSIIISYLYDLDNGQGTQEIKYQHDFRTLKEDPKYVLNITGYDKSSFTINHDITDKDNALTFKGVKIYLNESLVKETMNLDELVFNGLYSDTKYKVVSTFGVDVNNGEREIVNTNYVTTSKQEKPSVDILLASTKKEITYSYVYSDVDNIGEVISVELYKGNQKVANGDESKEFKGLLSNTLYELRITVCCDYQNGKEKVNEVYTKTIQTSALSDIDLLITGEVSKNNITFNYQLTDFDNIAVIKEINIYKDGALYKQLDNLDLREFNDLLSNTVYKLEIVCELDFNDGKNKVVKKYSKEFTTENYFTPIVDMEFVNDVNEINIKVNVIDNDNLLTINKVDVYKGSQLIKTFTEFENLVVDGLDANTLYTFKVEYKYNLYDGRGEIVKVYEDETTTLATPVKVISYEMLNQSNPKTNEVVSVKFSLENESRTPVNYVYVNGERLSVVGGDRINDVIVNFKAAAESGLAEYSVDKLEYVLNEIVIIQPLENLVSFNVEVLTRLDILKITTLEGTERVKEGSTGVVIIVDNPDGFKLLKVGTNYGNEEDVYRIDDTHYYLNYNLSSGTQTITFTSLKYEDASGNVAVRKYEDPQQIKITAITPEWDTDSLIVNKISTPEEFINLESGKDYELVNDIDMTGYEWVPTGFNGFFEGNGYTIKNLKIVEENEYEWNNRNFDIFTDMRGTFQNVYFENIYISCQSNGYLNVGLFGGYNDCIINSVLFKGDVYIESRQGYNFTMSNEAGVYVVDSLTVNGVPYKHKNIITSEQFANEDFKLNTLGWNFIKKEYKEFNGFHYFEIDNCYVYIHSYIGEDSDVVIPETINNKPVVAIGDLAFQNNETIKGINIPSSIVYIGGSILDGCNNIEKIYLDVDDFGVYKLFGRTQYDNTYWIHDSRYVPYSLKEVYLGESVKTVSDWSLYEFKLNRIYLSNNITKIGNYGLHTAWDLNTIIIIPNSLKEIGFDGLRDYSNVMFEAKDLSKIKVDRDLKLENVSFNIKDYVETDLYDYYVTSDETVGLIKYKGEKNYCVLDRIDSKPIEFIGSSAFGDYGIGFTMYYSGTSIPESWGDLYVNVVLNVKQYVENDEYNYYVTHDNLVGIIKYTGTKGTLTIDQIDGKDVYYIGSNAFRELDRVQAVTIGPKVVEIGDYAFADCRNLKELYISKGIEKIGYYAFGNSYDKNVYYDGTIEDWCLMDLSDSDASNPAYGSRLYFSKDGKYEQVREIIIPNTITSINRNQFNNIYDIRYVVIPNEITNVEKYAFWNIYCPIYVTYNFRPSEWDYEWTTSSSIKWDTKSFGENEYFKYYVNNDDEVGIISFNKNNVLIDKVDGKDIVYFENTAFEYGVNVENVYVSYESKPQSWNVSNYTNRFKWNVKGFGFNEEFEYYVTNNNQIGLIKYIGSSSKVHIKDIDGMKVVYVSRGVFNNKYIDTLYVSYESQPETWESINNVNKYIWNIKEYGSNSEFEYYVTNNNQVGLTKYIGSSSKVHIKDIDGMKVVYVAEWLFENKYIETLYVSYESQPETWSYINYINKYIWNVKEYGSNSEFEYYVTNNNLIGITKYIGSSSKAHIKDIDGKKVAYVDYDLFNNQYIETLYVSYESQPETWESINNVNKYIWNVKEYGSNSEFEYYVTNNNQIGLSKYIGGSSKAHIKDIDGKKVAYVDYDLFNNQYIETLYVSYESQPETWGYIANKGEIVWNVKEFNETSKYNYYVDNSGKITLESFKVVEDYYYIDYINGKEVSYIKDGIMQNSMMSGNPLLCAYKSQPSTWDLVNSTAVVNVKEVVQTNEYDYYITNDNLVGLLKYKGSWEGFILGQVDGKDVSYIENCFFNDNATSIMYVSYKEKLPTWSNLWMTIVPNVKEFASNNEYDYFVTNDNTVGIIRYKGDSKNLVLSDIDGKKVTYIETMAFGSYQGSVIYCDYPEIPEEWNNVMIPIRGNVKEHKETELYDYYITNDNLVGIVKYKGDSKNLILSDIDGKRVAYIESMAFGSYQGSAIYCSYTDIPEEWNHIMLPIYSNVKEYKETELYNYYVTNDKLVAVLKYKGSEYDLVLDKIDGMDIYYIGEYAFANNENIESVILGSGIRQIDDFAFHNCNYLRTVTMNGGIESVGCYAFQSNTWTSENKLFFNGTIEEWLNMDVEEGALHIYNGGDVLFFNGAEYGRLKEIVIPSSIKELRNNAFTAFYDVNMLYIPSTIENIYYGTFNSCSVSTVLMEASSRQNGFERGWDNNLGNIKWGIKEYTTEGDFSYYVDKDNLVTITKYNGVSSKVIIDKINGMEVAYVAPYAFSYCDHIQEITLPNTIKTIGTHAFAYCRGLQKITMHKGIESIGSWAFGDTYNKKVNYNGTLEDWCNMKFEDSDSANPAYGSYLYMINSNGEYEQVKEIIIPETITSIGKNQFSNIYGINLVYIPKTVVKIEEYAFCNIYCSIYVGVELRPGTWNYQWTSSNDIVYNVKNVVSNDECLYYVKDDGIYIINYKNKDIYIKPIDGQDIIYLNSGAFRYGYNNIYSSYSQPLSTWDESINDYDIKWNVKDFGSTDEFDYYIRNDNVVVLSRYKGSSNTVYIDKVNGMNVYSIEQNCFSNFTMETVYSSYSSKPTTWGDINNVNNYIWNVKEISKSNDFEYYITNDNLVVLSKYLGDESKVYVDKINGMDIYNVEENCFNNRGIDLLYCSYETKPTTWGAIYNVSKFIWNVKEYKSNENFEYYVTNNNQIGLTKYIGNESKVVINDIDGKKVAYVNEWVFDNKSIETLYVAYESQPETWGAIYNANRIIWNAKEYKDTKQYSYYINCNDEIVVTSIKSKTNGYYVLGYIDGKQASYLDSEFLWEIDYQTILCQYPTKPSTMDYNNLGSNVKEVVQTNEYDYYITNDNLLGLLKYKGSWEGFILGQVDGKDVSYIESCFFNDWMVSTLYVSYKEKLPTWTNVWHTVVPNVKEFASNNEYDYFVTNDNTAGIIRYKGDSKNLVLSDIDGKEVTYIETMAFGNYQGSVIYCDYPEIPEEWENLWIPIRGNVKEYKETELYDYYITNDNLVGIVKYKGNDFEIALDKLDGMDIYYIGNYAFQGAQYLEVITLPKALKEIGSYAFVNCSNIETIVMYGNVEKIGDYAFNSLGWNSNRQLLFNGTLEDWCSINAGNYALPTEGIHVRFMIDGEYADLEEIVIPESITSLRARIFYGFNSVRRIYIPATVKNITSESFEGFSCSDVLMGAELRLSGYEKGWNNGLSNIKWGIKEYVKGEEYDYYVDKDDLVTITKYHSPNQYVVIDKVDGKAVAHIGAYAFYYCDHILEITLPNTIKTIGDYAFAYCRSLQKITMHKGIETIESWAFGDTYSKKVHYNGTLEDWCNMKFEDSDSANPAHGSYLYMINSNGEYEQVKEIIIPETIKSIGDYQFNNIYDIELTYIPKTVTKVGYNAFWGIGGKIYTQFEYRPNGWAYEWTSSSNVVYGINGFVSNELYDYYVNDSNEIVLVKYKGTEENVVLDKIDGKDIVEIQSNAFISNYSIRSIELPKNLKIIRYNAFNGCGNMNNVIMYNKVEHVEESGFGYGSKCVYYNGTIADWCKIKFDSESSNPAYQGYLYLNNGTEYEMVSKIVIPDEVTIIGKYQFAYIHNVNEIYIHENVTEIGYNAFWCPSWPQIYCEAESKPNGWDSNWYENAYVNWDCTF